jgi:hypothetical protein
VLSAIDPIIPTIAVKRKNHQNSALFALPEKTL